MTQPSRSRWHLIMRGLAVLSALASLAAGLLSLSLAAVWWQGAIDHLVEVVAGRYSADGIVSDAGMAIVGRAITMTGWLAAGLSIAGTVLAWMLWRLARSPESPEPQGQQAWWAQAPLRPAGLITVIALILLIAGAAIRAPRLRTSFVYDEIFTIQRFAVRPVLEIPFLQEGFNNHMLNSMVLHGLLRWSSAEAVLRLPTFLAGMASLWLLFLIGRQWAGPAVGLLVIWLAAVSPYHVAQSTLARGYMLGLALSLSGLLVLLKAGRPPQTRALIGFVGLQALASIAVPTVVIVPVLLTGWVLLGWWPWGRRLTGIDPRSTTGLRWLVAAVSTVIATAIINLPMVPHLLRVKADAVRLETSWSGWSAWLQDLHPSWIGIVLLLELAGMGAAAAVLRLRGGEWRARFLLALWLTAFLGGLFSGSPARTHVLGFAGWIMLAALGISRLAARRSAAWGLALGLGALSFGSLVSSASGMADQDVRGAVRFAETSLPANGVILTSGFTSQEIDYYASRPVRPIASTEDLADALAAQEPFCYFRLFAESAGSDPVLAYFYASGPPQRLISGQDPIAVWCGQAGQVVQHEQGTPSA